MTHMPRPTQITAIMQAISSEHDPRTSAELNTYIADLEARQPDRPSRIAVILQALSTQHSVEMITALTAYISDLEARQQTPVLTGTTPPTDSQNPPVWSHQRTMLREQNRRERAMRKLNDYR